MKLFVVAVDADHRQEALQLWSNVPYQVFGDGDDVAKGLSELLRHLPYAIVVHGDDRLISRLISAYYGQLRYSEEPLRLMPLTIGSLQQVSQALDSDITPRKAARLLTNNGGVDPVRFELKSITSMKVSSSMEELAHYGFSFGAGWLYHAFEHYYRKNAVTAMTAAMQWGKEFFENRQNALLTPANFSVDYNTLDDSLGYLIASTLPKSWFGISFGESTQQPNLIYSHKSGDLIRSIAGGRKMGSFFGGKVDTRTFQRCHIAWSSGYTLDGNLFSPARPYTLQITQGPPVQFLRWQGALLERATNYLRR